MNSKSKFEFNEIVRIISSDNVKYQNQTGVLLGKVSTESRGWYYTVLFNQFEETACFYETQMKSLGYFVNDNYHKSGETLKVYVDKDGVGYSEEENE